MRRQLLPALLMTVVLTVLTGIAYPLVVTGVSPSLLGQGFTKAMYFHPRPSMAGDGYDGLASGASNLGPSNPDLLKTVEGRVAAYRQENGLATGIEVPVDAVTASASGLDPDISVANARLQVKRVADARDIAIDDVLAAVARHTQDQQWGFLGEKVVNVLALNLDLDRGR
jgi:K+-transporting ATPase ATPase C chain